MNTYQEDTYGDRIAGVYDAWYAEYDDATLVTLRELAQGGRALELGIGTGRIALPLQQSGVIVDGIDASAAMIAKLHSKSGGDKISVVLGNFADVAVAGEYTLIYVLFNTFFSLLTQEEQLRCFRNVAQHLGPQGSFVVEAFAPDLSRFSDHQAVRAVRISENEVRLDASQLDPVNQQITSQHVVLTEQGIRLYPVKLRYVWPAELDLMARLAGLQLKYRWGNWRKAAFTADSGKHVSVYEHAE
ncbi:MAG: class I SAM-dependent methyltransferase [Chloroflexi bacterium]|nr:class I SAM-dependent methyltransferase [Chloroflexota bacterium]